MTGNQAQLDRNTDSEVEVDCASCDCYYSPELEEFIVIEDAVAASEFDNEVSLIAHRMNEYAQAKHDYGVMLEEYEKEKQKSTADQRVKSIEIAIDHLEARMENARKLLHEAIQVKDEPGVDDYVSYQDMIELIPLARRSREGEKANKHKDLLGRKFVYASREKYQLDTRNPKKGFKKIKPKYTEQLGGRKSIYYENKKGKRKIDAGLLKEQIKSIRPELELYSFAKSIESEGLFEWANSWNNLDGNVLTSAEAQALRFAMNMGASASWTSNGLEASAYHASSFNVVEAKASANYFYPDKIGWLLKYTVFEAQGGSPEQAINMGNLRVELQFNLEGSVGASILLNGSLEAGYVENNGKKDLVVRGYTAPKKRTQFSQRQNKGITISAEQKQLGGAMQGGGNVFVGAQAGAGLSGALQWLKPLGKNMLIKDSPTAKYENFCSVAAGVSALAGGGIGGAFSVSFKGGNLLLEVDASVCLGLGARGRAGFMVGAEQLFEFLQWFSYQLYHVDFTRVNFIDEEDFKVVAKIMALQFVQAGLIAVEKIFEDAKGLIDNIVDYYEGFITEISGSRERLVLSQDINARPEAFLCLLPESRAMLLWMLTESSFFDIKGETYFFDRYRERKQAILNILQGIQTKREWNNVMCRINKEASFLDSPSDKFAAIDRGEQRISDFLTHGINRDHEMYKIKHDLTRLQNQDFSMLSEFGDYMLLAVDAIKLRLKSKPAFGYPVAMNYTPTYRLHTEDNPEYLAMCNFDSNPDWA